MLPSKRILTLGIVFETALAVLAWYLISQLRSGAMQPSGTVEEAVTTIMRIIGATMGGLGGGLIVLYLLLRRKENSA